MISVIIVDTLCDYVCILYGGFKNFHISHKNVLNNMYTDLLTLALLKAHISLQLGKIFSSDNEISVYIMYSYMFWLLHCHKAGELISNIMYGRFMNVKYLCTCLKSIWQGYTNM